MQGIMYIIIVLLLLFTGFLCLSINFTAAFKVSDSIVNQINKDEGIHLENISNVLREAGYSSSGGCGDGWTAFRLGQNNIDLTTNEGNYCIKKIAVSDTSNPEIPRRYYYRVKVFYKVDVPLLNRLNLNVQADTMQIYEAKEDEPGYVQIPLF